MPADVRLSDLLLASLFLLVPPRRSLVAPTQTIDGLTSANEHPCATIARDAAAPRSPYRHQLGVLIPFGSLCLFLSVCLSVLEQNENPENPKKERGTTPEHTHSHTKQEKGARKKKDEKGERDKSRLLAAATTQTESSSRSP